MANQQDRKDEDENQTNDTSEETTEKKDSKKVYCVICEKESSSAHKRSVCDQFVHAICGSYSEDSEGFGLKVACNLCVRKNRINIEREGAKSGFRSLALTSPLTATTRLSHHGISSNATTPCGCLNAATTRHFALWLFL